MVTSLVLSDHSFPGIFRFKITHATECFYHIIMVVKMVVCRSTGYIAKRALELGLQDWSDLESLMFVFCILWSLVAESNWHHIDCLIHYRPQKYHIHDETEERDFLFSERLIWCCSAVLTEKGCKFALLPYFLKGKHPELYRFITWYSTKSSHYNFF